MEDADKSYLMKLQDHLSNLLRSNNVTGFEFKIFDNFLQFDYKLIWDDWFQSTAKLIENLLEKNEKNLSFCIDLVRVLFIVASRKWPRIVENFISSEIDESYEWLKPLVDRLKERHGVILFFGVLAFVTTSRCTFCNGRFYDIIDEKMIREIPRLISDVKYVDAVFRATDEYLTLLLEKAIPKDFKTSTDIIRSVLSVIIALWNHRLVYQSRVEQVLLKCLMFDHSCVKEDGSSKHIVDMLIFKYMMDISWKLPFKYFICLNILKFALLHNEIPQVLNIIKEELSHGFTKILQNKSVVGPEMELFTFCLNNFPSQEWEDIVQPIANSALSKISSSSNLAKWWLPQISKKSPMFIDSFYQSLVDNADKGTYPKVLVTILKICNTQQIKLPCLEQEEIFLNYLKTLFSLAEENRGDVFALLCDLHYQSVLHSEQELDTIMIFLRFNVNSNCTMLRQIILNSFSKFVLRLICSCVKIIKKNETETDERLGPALKFLRDLNDFIADGIQPGCSYQRKITSLNLFKILMTYAVRECGNCIHVNNLRDADKFVDFVKKKNSWNFQNNENRKLLFYCLMDFCVDVQNVASILLRNYFQLHGIQSEIFEEALVILKDSKFYKRNSGVSAIVSLISMAYSSYNKLCVCMYIEYTSFTEFFTRLLESKIEIMSKDILQAAVNHPLDADIDVLNFLITDKTSPEFDFVTKQQIEKLITLLEEVVPLLLKALFVDESSDYAPSFEESDLALRALIKTSDLSESFASAGDDEQCQLQPLNQLLLNFIWITLKVCGKFESDLIVNRIDQLSEEQIIRCCNLTINKLKLCRHKGAIEAAGVALSTIVPALFSHNICVDWLESVVMDVLHLIEFKSGATISRKSAGLSILIQNIVANDKRPNKPLVVKCWVEFRRILVVDYESINTDISEEIPQTHALHLLRVLVADARNATDLLPYMEEITVLCLTTLKAPMWIIRNAALQLFGIILLRLAGQRNAKPEIRVRHSFEEMFLTMPGILDHMIITMKQANQQSHDFVQHADLAPLLVILMNVQLCSTIILDTCLHEKLLDIRVLVESFLNSDLYTIRELASKALLALHSPEEIRIKMNSILSSVTEHITRQKPLKGENHVHGCLLALKQVYDFYPQFKKVISKRNITLQQSLHISLVSQALLFNMEMVDTNVSLDYFLHHVEHVLNILQHKRHLSMGYDQWLQEVFYVILKYFNHVEVIRKCSSCPHSAILLACLDNLTEMNESLCSELLQCLTFHLERDNNDTVLISRIIETFIRLYNSECKISCDDNFVEKYFDILKELGYYRFQGANVHFLGILVASSGYRIDDTLLITLETLNIIKFNKNIRLNSAYCMLNLSKILNKYNPHKKLIWRILVDLIQDEEIDIRFIGSKCFINIFQIEIDYGPEMAMNALFDLDIMSDYLDTREFVDLLWDKLETISFETTLADQVLNPFDQGIKNCYEEEIKIVSLAGNAFKKLIQKDSNLCETYLSNEKIRSYFDTYFADISRICESDDNKFFMYANNYVLSLRCYYLLYIHQCISKSVEKQINEHSTNLEKVLKL